MLPTETELVGRVRERAAIDAALDALDRGTAGWLGMCGEPGIGKSRLLAELQDRAGDRGHQVLAGRVAEFESELPYSVFVDALDVRLQSTDDAQLRRMGIERLDELAAMFPALQARVATDAPLLQADRYRAHRALRELLDALAVTRPLVLVLDDLHWADPASLELIQALLRRPPERPVLIACGYRRQDATAKLHGALVQAQAAGMAQVHELPGLDEREATQLLGDSVTGDRRAAVLREAGGNPFYLEQLARASSASASPAPVLVLEGGFRVPATVAAALEEELAALDFETQLVLAGGAVAGEPFEVSLAADVAGVPLPAALAAVDAAEAAGLVRPAGAPGALAFRHPLVRRAVYERSGEGWRLAAHARAAASLASRGADAIARAHHLERCAERGDEEAIAVLTEAGDRTAARAPASAAFWFQGALRLTFDDDLERRRELLERLARSLLAAGRLQESHAALLEAHELADREGAGLDAEAELALAEVEQWLGQPEQARRRLTAAREKTGDGNPRAAAAIELRLTMMSIWDARMQDAMTHGQAALAAAEAAGDPLVLAAVKAMLAEAAAHVDVNTARVLHDDAAALIEGISAERIALWMDVMYSLGWSATHLERYEDGLRHFDRGIEIARATGVDGYLVTLLSDRAEPLMRLGRVRDAIRAADEAVEAAHLNPSPRRKWWALWIQSAVLLRAGEVERAEAVTNEATELSKSLPKEVLTPLWMGYQHANVLATMGDHERAVQVLVGSSGGEDMPLIPPNDRQWAWEILVGAALHRGDLDAAEATVTAAEEASAASGLRGLVGFATRCRACLQAAREDWEGALDAAQRSAAAFDEVGTVLEAERSRLLAAGWLADLGRRDEAAALLEPAAVRLEAVGAERDRAVAVRALRSLGRRTRARAGGDGVRGGGDAPAGLDELSTREREVAELVAERCTNREIAERLVLSEKTVETHLRNIFGKLGVASRRDVAAVLDRARAAAAE